jgi:hypothetical protein
MLQQTWTLTTLTDSNLWASAWALHVHLHLNNKLLKRSWDNGSTDVTRWSHHKSPDLELELEWKPHVVGEGVTRIVSVWGRQNVHCLSGLQTCRKQWMVSPKHNDHENTLVCTYNNKWWHPHKRCHLITEQVMALLHQHVGPKTLDLLNMNHLLIMHTVGKSSHARQHGPDKTLYTTTTA